MSDLKSDADLLHLALTHEGDEFAARVVNDLQTQLAAMTAERDCDEKRVNALMDDLDRVAKERDTAVLNADISRKQIAARELERQTEFRTRLAVEKERDAALAKVAVLREVTAELEVTIRVMGLDSEPLARMAENARNALEATK